MPIRPPAPSATRATSLARPARAFTLLEVVLSLFILGLLMTAIASAVVLAAKAAPDPAGPAAATADAAEVASLLAAELPYAQSVTELTPTAITFTAPGRAGDGAVDTVRYAWSGSPGGPLTRTANGATGVLLPACAGFALRYDRRVDVKNTNVTTDQTGGEVLLASFVAYSIGGTQTRVLPLTSAVYGSQVFQIDPAALPANTTKVTLTRVKLWMQGVPGGGATTVGIYKASGAGTPTGAPVGQLTTVDAASIPTGGYAWVDVPLANATTTSTTQDQCIVVRGTTGTPGATIEYLYNSKAPKDGPVLLWSTDAGATWQPSASTQNQQDMKFCVYGVCTSSTTTTVPTSAYHLRTVAVSLAAGRDASAHLDTAVRLLNQPSVSGP